MQGVEYNVNMSLTGAGAEQAIAQLRALQTQFGVTATAATAMTGGAARAATATATLSSGTRALRAEVRAMSGAVTLLGLQHFPQLTMSAMVAQQGMRGLKIAVAETGVALKVLAPLTIAAGAGLYALFKFGQANWEMFQQVGASNEAEAKAIAQSADSMAKMYERAIEAVTEGRLQLSEAEAQWLDQLMTSATPERSRQLHDFLKERLPAGHFMSQGDRSTQTREELQALELSQELSRTASEYLGLTTTLASKRTIIMTEYADQLRLINSLEERGMITAQQAADMRTRQDIQRMRGLTQLRSELTELQRLGQEVSMQFAGGLSTALVKAFSEGGAALKEFFVQFMQQVAQMILQMLIMAALKKMLGGVLGFSEGGVATAAGGGLFPRFAANGLSGVSSVSRPTYFPRFNVVAGEAGREMLTVLARPRFMEIGGVQSVVGQAGGNTLAISSAAQLAGRAGAGGSVQIHVSMEPGLRAAIVDQSVSGAVVRVTNDMGTNTPLKRVTKQAMK